MMDRISSLHDSLIFHILSFLPTKDAVATSILSKRWRSLWPSLPTVDIDDRTFIPKNLCSMELEKHYLRFVQFVDTIFILRGSQPITKFSLKCRRSGHTSNIYVWVNAALQRRVQYLDLYISKPNIKIPTSNVFNSTNLVVLKLHYLIIDSLPSVHLPSLKRLHLKSIRFSDRKFIPTLLSGCPILKDLTLLISGPSDLLSWENYVRLPQLRHAHIPNVVVPLQVLQTVKILHISPNLYSPYLGPEILFYKLTHMKLYQAVYNWSYINLMLQDSPKLQLLIIEKSDVNDGGEDMKQEEDWQEPKVVPRCFSSHFTKCEIQGFRGLDMEIRFARYIMKNAKGLRAMKICSESSLSSDVKLEILKRLSSCPRSSSTCGLWFE